MAPGARRLAAEAARLLRSEHAGGRPDAAGKRSHRPVQRGRSAGDRQAGHAAAGLALERAELRQLRPGVQGRAPLRRQLQRLQYLRHRGSEARAAASPRSSARAGRATSRSTATCCSCRWSRRAAGSTAAPAASKRRSATSASAASASSTSPTCASPRQVAAVQTCRGSHTHTLVTDPKDKDNLYVYGSGTSTVRSGEELAGCSSADPKDDPEHRALQHRRHPGAARRAREVAHRQSAAHLRRPGHGRDCRPQSRRQPGARRPAGAGHQSVPRHHRLPGNGAGRRRMRGQRHPARHQRSGAPGAARRGDRQELRLLAFGHVQQRRHEGDLHRRVGRRHAAALPGDRSADLGRRRHLRHRRSQAALRRLLQDAGAADRSGELRGPQRFAHPGARPRHHGAGVVPGRRVGVRLHRLDASPSRSPTSTAARSTPRSSSPAATGRPTGTTGTSTARRSRAGWTSSS